MYSDYKRRRNSSIMLALVVMFAVGAVADPVVCNNYQFRCDNNHCVYKLNYCDGDNDCKDWSDEPASCKSKNCTGSTGVFSCGSTDSCIPLNWTCDGYPDCLDGRDESIETAGCDPVVCQNNQFRCDNNHCVYKHEYCDGNNDCNDWSDEPASCTHLSKSHDCQFSCGGNECIPLIKTCDGSQNCRDGRDESREAAGCASVVCGNDEYGCHNNHCVSFNAICDRYNDCKDWSDELIGQNICSVLFRNDYGVLFRNDYGDEDCPDGMFKCANEYCVQTYYFCDQYDDCGDNSDEPALCGYKTTISDNSTVSSNTSAVPANSQTTPTPARNTSDVPANSQTTTDPARNKETVFLTVIIALIVVVIICVSVIISRYIRNGKPTTNEPEPVMMNSLGIVQESDDEHAYDEISVLSHVVVNESNSIDGDATVEIYSTRQGGGHDRDSSYVEFLVPALLGNHATHDTSHHEYQEVVHCLGKDHPYQTIDTPYDAYCLVKTADGRKIDLPPPIVPTQTNEDQTKLHSNIEDTSEREAYNYCLVKAPDGRKIDLPPTIVPTQTNEDQIKLHSNIEDTNERETYNYCLVKTADGRKIDLPPHIVPTQTNEDQIKLHSNIEDTNEREAYNYCLVKTPDGRHIALPPSADHEHVSEEETEF